MSERIAPQCFAVWRFWNPANFCPESQVAPATSFVYTETDNSNPGQNAVIAYRRSANGQLTEIGSFKTGGTGVANPQGLLGPFDSDKEVIASPDGQFLFAVNQGSNSVAVFQVHNDGSLRLIKHTGGQLRWNPAG